MGLMQIRVQDAPALASIYTPTPKRMAYLEPGAWQALRLAFLAWPTLRWTDLFRSPEASLAAVAAGRGAQLPGYSGHNYGFCVDIDVDYALGGPTSRGKTKYKLDEHMESYGWVCHRRDGKRGREDWHFSHIPYATIAGNYSSDELERKIVDNYGAYWAEAAANVAVEQECLRECKLYSGELDGKPGPLTEQARKVFRRAWKIGDNEKQRYIRTLSLVAARK